MSSYFDTPPTMQTSVQALISRFSLKIWEKLPNQVKPLHCEKVPAISMMSESTLSLYNAAVTVQIFFQ
ncbi:hypothetical protein C7H79_11390 [Nitrosomonas supralitoralis]|uniref:Uncharacterized protein n=1 Tax=Nitrosomonas supralitoralis TaxID=2116706 RepID=A0A2P7NTL9_9PROT|nr:hypothetical protein C7H79_11390 [Nitrosomonas supralitoralis]